MVADDNEAHWTLGQYWTRPRRPAGPIGIAVAHAEFAYKRRAACDHLL